MNDLVVSDKHIIPLFARPRPRGVVNKLNAGAVGLGQRHLVAWATGTRTPDAPGGTPSGRQAGPAAVA
jgi:hypothetical protein